MFMETASSQGQNEARLRPAHNPALPIYDRETGWSGGDAGTLYMLRLWDNSVIILPHHQLNAVGEGRAWVATVREALEAGYGTGWIVTSGKIGPGHVPDETRSRMLQGPQAYGPRDPYAGCTKRWDPYVNEISETRYIRMLGELPPLDYTRRTDFESFRFMEAVTTDTYQHFARLGNPRAGICCRYFEVFSVRVDEYGIAAAIDVAIRQRTLKTSTAG